MSNFVTTPVPQGLRVAAGDGIVRPPLARHAWCGKVPNTGLCLNDFQGLVTVPFPGTVAHPTGS